MTLTDACWSGFLKSGGMRASKNEFAFALPQSCMTLACFCVHSSSVTDRTKLRCVPRPRWSPLQLKQMKVPREHDAQLGLGARQSAQCMFSGRLLIFSTSLRIDMAPEGGREVRTSRRCWLGPAFMSVFA